MLLLAVVMSIFLSDDLGLPTNHAGAGLGHVGLGSKIVVISVTDMLVLVGKLALY